MYNPEIAIKLMHQKEWIRTFYFALSVGPEEKVNSMTESLRTDGFKLIGEPRTTGCGYYERVVLNPEWNQI
ncbi:hypothetical protein ACNR9Q_02685 [Maribacter sp. X9]|uniref:hypothetical protein n=1 Tax=Maribacter sp. X9 TaxID=3402159 RepID=UPI003AF3CA82